MSYVKKLLSMVMRVNRLLSVTRVINSFRVTRILRVTYTAVIVASAISLLTSAFWFLKLTKGIFALLQLLEGFV
jgi:hypothetical protein